MKHRPERMSHLLRKELGEMLLREFEFTGALITLTEVVVSADLEHAKAKISVMPHKNEKPVLSALQKMTGHFQHELNHKLNFKPMPRLMFALDEGPERAAAIEKDLLEIEKSGDK
jgi:ribosome-binding factor A